MQRLNQDYEILSLLGIGGFGEVFKCREIISGHIVAVKRLKTSDQDKQRNILKEIRLLSKLNHPGIVKYLHTFRHENQLHLVMEFCEQGSLASNIGKTGIALSESTGIISSLIETMNWVHNEGITHHDIKPQNILINAANELKIADFGVANTLGGTSSYQAPELFFKPDISPDDKRADIYAMGLTIVELLTGENPFSGKRLGEIMIAHKTRAYGTGHLPYWLQDFLIKAIHPRPEERFQTMEEMLNRFKQRNIPEIITAKVLEAGEAGRKLLKELRKGNLHGAEGYAIYLEQKMPSHPHILKALGKYYLMKGDLDQAEEKFSQLFAKSQILSVHNDYARALMLRKEYSRAIGVLSDQIQLNPDDMEAYSLLGECYLRSERYDTGLELLSLLKKKFVKVKTFTVNHFLFRCANASTEKEWKRLEKEAPLRTLMRYNLEVFRNNPEVYCNDKGRLNDKLVYMDFIFNTYYKSNPWFSISRSGAEFDSFQTSMVVIGRLPRPDNDITLPGSDVSRRHCMILNALGQVWVYDLGSITGTFVDGKRVLYKQPLFGRCELKIGKHTLEIVTDKRKLF